MTFRLSLLARLLTISLGWLGVNSLALAADGSVVEASGEALIKNGDTVTAKKAAIADALKNCIEKVLGMQITSEFTAAQREIVQNNQSEFNAYIKDNLTQKSEGFIQSHEILSETTKDNVITVTVRAKVFESKVKAKAVELAELIAKAGNPKIMLIIQEIYSNPAKNKRTIAKTSIIAAHLEKELLAKGFELRGAKTAKKIGDDSPETFDKWLEDAGGAAQVAREQGADVLIAGRVEIINKGKIEDAGGLTELEGQIQIEIISMIRGILTANSEVFSTKPVTMRSVGINRERAIHRALRGSGQNAIKQTFSQLLIDLKKSFKKIADTGQNYVVILNGVKSYRKHGIQFIKALKSIDGVSEVMQKSFKGSKLIVNVSFKGSLNDLQPKIFESLEQVAGFSNLDVDNISGKQISLKL
ncbi:MAG: flagellar assembly protein T N-terminal domain-containing protein [Deltaproteobacteria bacterium]|nr:flagellar assembly protein T N-terminal domain-containing protein [Deltaproteobacteria bacterium]